MKQLFLAVVILLPTIVLAQVNAGPDQIICIGESTTLQGNGSPSFTYLWTSDPFDPTISDPTSLTTSIQPSDTTVYTLRGRSVSYMNLVDNGNFETGDNTGVTSSYIYSPGPNGIWQNGTYAITNDASYNHNNFTCDTDHTTGTGYFMVVNGSWNANTVVWSQIIPNITPDTEYEFSTWVSSLSPISPALLQFKINGELLGQPFQASSSTCDWYQFFEEWNSGSATSAEISIINQNTAANGNDFSLDDINFSEVTYYYDDCIVDVVPIPTSDFSMPAQSCSADTVIIDYTGSATATALYYWDFGTANVFSGSGPGPYEVQWPTTGMNSVSLYVDYGCLSNTTTNNINILQTPSVLVSADATSIPYGTTTTLHGSMSGNPGPLVFQWDPAIKLVDSLILDPETEILDQNTIFSFTATDQSSLCSAVDTVLINVTGGPLLLLSYIAIQDTVCYGDSATLELTVNGGSGNYSFTWTSDPSGLFNYSGTETTLKVLPLTTMTYIVEVSDGFTVLPKDSITVTVLPQIEIMDQPDDTMVALGQNAVYSVDANYGQFFQWEVSSDNASTWNSLSDDAIYSGTNTPVLTLTNIPANFNSFLYHCLVDGACSPVLTDSAKLTVITSPQFIGVLEDVQVCQNDTVHVPCRITNFIEVDSFNMTFLFNTSMLQFTEIGNVKSELSTMIVSHNNDSINLKWTSQTGVTISDGVFFDVGFIANTGGYDSIIWTPESSVRNIYGYNPDIQLLSGNINITPTPIEPDYVLAYPDSLNIIDLTDITLEAFGGSGNYVKWTEGSCDGDSVGEGILISFERPQLTTSYYAQWRNQCGGSECKQVEVKIVNDFPVSVPNAFTPDGDGLNDGFGVVTPGKLPFFELSVFNRWGQMVFHTENQYELWDGTYNGEKAPIATYVWKIKYQFTTVGLGSDIKDLSGTVTIIKQ